MKTTPQNDQREAIARRLEAIASSNKKLLGWRPSVLGWGRPSVLIRLEARLETKKVSDVTVNPRFKPDLNDRIPMLLVAPHGAGTGSPAPLDRLQS